MGAIAVPAEDERRIVRLGKRLGVRSKAGVVDLADDLGAGSSARS